LLASAHYCGVGEFPGTASDWTFSGRRPWHRQPQVRATIKSTRIYAIIATPETKGADLEAMVAAE
jgi:hypothetical protein